MSLKTKIKNLEEKITEARAEVAATKPAVDEAREQLAGKGIQPGSDEFAAAEAAVKAHGAAVDELHSLVEEQRLALKLADDPSQTTTAGNANDPRRDAWSSREQLADPALRAQLDRAANTKGRVGPIEIGEVASRDAMVADVTGTAGLRRGETIGVVPQLRRKLQILDLLPTGTMDGNSLPYTQESGSLDTAVEQDEGAAKAEGAVTLTDAEAPAVTIAHWQKVRKQALADVAALQGIIDSRLRYGVLRRLEKQVIAGNGTAPNMRGILNTPGVGSVAFTAGALAADQVLKAITTVMLADGEPTGVVMSPADWQNALLAKAAGDGHYFSGGPFQVTPQTMWGVPLVPSVAVPANTALVGDFEIGAQLFIREGVSVLMSDSDQDDFVRNRVTLLAEMRAALAVFRPAVFATAALA